MQTIKKIDEVFQNIVDNHKQLNSLQRHSFDEMDINKVNVTDYPILYAQVTSSTIEGNEIEFEYEVVVASIVLESQLSTINDVYNQTHIILQDVIAFLHMEADALPEDERFVIDLPINTEPFTGRFTNLLTGWGCTISIRVPLALNLCEAAFDDYTPVPPFLGLPVTVTDGDLSVHEVEAGGSYTCIPATPRSGIFYQRIIPWTNNDPGIDGSVYWHFTQGTYNYTPPTNPEYIACKRDTYEGTDDRSLLMQLNAFGNLFRFTNDRGQQFVEDFHLSGSNSSDYKKLCIDHLTGLAFYVQAASTENTNRNIGDAIAYANSFSYAGISEWRLADTSEYLEGTSTNDWRNAYNGVYAPMFDTSIRSVGGSIWMGSFTPDNEYLYIQTNGNVPQRTTSSTAQVGFVMMVTNYYL